MDKLAWPSDGKLSMRKRPSAPVRAEKQSRAAWPERLLNCDSEDTSPTMASETQTSAPAIGWSFSSSTTPARIVGAVSTSGSDESARLEFQFFQAGAKPAFLTTTRFAPGGEEKANPPLLSVTACSLICGSRDILPNQPQED